MHENITSALNFITRHSDTFIAGSLGVGGTLLGVAISYFLERRRDSGKVKLEPMDMHWRYDRLAGIGSGPETAKQVDFHFSIRAINTYSHAKSCEIQSVEFFEHKTARFGKTNPLFKDPFLMIGPSFADTEHRTMVLPPKVNTMMFCSGAGVTDVEDVQERTAMLKKFRWVRLRFLISPNKIETVWHKFPESDFKPAKPARAAKPTVLEI